MINFNLSLFFLHLSLARFNSPLRHCSPNLLEMTPSSNLSHPNLSDCLAPPVRRAKRSLNWYCRMRIKEEKMQIFTSRELFWRRWMNCPISVCGLLSVKRRKIDLLKFQFNQMIFCNVKRLAANELDMLKTLTDMCRYGLWAVQWWTIWRRCR